MKKAFSLVELMVVIAIIGILAGVLMASFSGGTESARAAKCLNNMRNLATGVISMAMKTDEYPVAGSHAGLSIVNIGKLYESVGWISWLSQGDPYHTHHDKDHRPEAFIPCANISAFCQDTEKAEFALTNGSIWVACRRDRDSYVCPVHRRRAQDLLRGIPVFSYAMNAYFGYDSTKGSNYESLYTKRERWNVTRPDRILLFAEIPFAIPGSTDDANEVSEDDAYSPADDNVLNDCVLQYKATVNGKNYNTTWSGTPEAIAFNHRSGKRYCAHVIFADGHSEKFLMPKSGSGLNSAQLTALLCEGIDVSFDGKEYNLINDADK